MSFLTVLAFVFVLGPLQERGHGFSPSPDPISGGSPLSWGDYDEDGLDDVFAIDAAGHGALFRNLGDGSFEEAPLVSDPSALEDLGFALWEDFDRDGALDLLLGGAAVPLRLLRNLGDGVFADVSAGLGTEAQLGLVITAEWRDYDQDGYPDLQVVGTRGARIYRNDGGVVFVGSSLPRPRRTGSGGSPGAWNVEAFPFCARAIDDAVSGDCIRASATPALGRLYPLSIDFNVDAAGNVGIGTLVTQTKLHVLDVGTGGAILGQTSAMNGAGVKGSHLGTGSNGIGVFGAHNGSGFGVYGASVSGHGVLGFQGSSTGTGTGVYGQANSPTALAGVYGILPFPGPDSAGVFGEIFNNVANGHGVLGRHGGSGSGVSGESATGVGVSGISQLVSSTSPGVRGTTLSTQPGAYGVHGIVTTGSPGVLAAGVRGENRGTGGPNAGVYGSHAGSGYGVYGTSATGLAVYGLSQGATGVLGATAAPGGFGVFAQGDLGASGTKSFVQPHPTDPAREIRFVCLEGNESGTYFRGSTRLANGRAVVRVPEEFRLASERDHVTVQLTAVGGRASLWVESKDLERVVLRGDADVQVDYLVNGIRRGFADFEPLRPNRAFVPEERGQPYGSQYPEALRRILVENGTLNADFTPNEGTAARNGWALRDPLPRPTPSAAASSRRP